MQVFTVNEDGIVLLPDYMAKAVMSTDSITASADGEVLEKDIYRKPEKKLNAA